MYFHRSGNFHERNVCAFNICRVAKWPSHRKIFVHLIFTAKATGKNFYDENFLIYSILYSVYVPCLHYNREGTILRAPPPSPPSPPSPPPPPSPLPPPSPQPACYPLMLLLCSYHVLHCVLPYMVYFICYSTCTTI